MLRPASNPQPQTVSDRELGAAALLLLIAVVLTALLVPLIA
ncbi:MAG TPA: hypothetical protein VLA76_03680 [Candidatus Angelobacter sp.]|nr:hypothetical protein [Candidatus Angelobacter sp.]